MRQPASLTKIQNKLNEEKVQSQKIKASVASLKRKEDERKNARAGGTNKGVREFPNLTETGCQHEKGV